MTSERWQQIRTIFDAAVECDSASRTEFLRQRCGGDEELLRQVESLLAGTSLLASPLKGFVSQPSHPVRPATLVLKDRYEVERELGRGGMSLVYLARDRQLLEKRVVVKVLLEESDIDPWVRQKFQQEMEALSRIDHPGVVGVLDNGFTAEGKQFLVMQYIEGETLRNAMASGSMDFTRAATLIRQVGRALAAAHEKGVWHRDLKPENIMLQCLSGEEHVKLIDFGIAGIQNSQFGGEKSKVAGTLTYMAPEQFLGHPCAASDTYALGVVGYEMLTGKKPFAADSMVHLVAEDGIKPTPLRELRPDLPAMAERSIRKAMSFRPEHRQASVREFSEELYEALGGISSSSVTARKAAAPGTEFGNRERPSKLTSSARPKSKSKGAVAALAALILIAAVACAWWFRRAATSYTPQDQASIAVLPFKDMSPEKNQEYFSEGLAEELLDTLSKIPGLRVAARTSSFKLRSEDTRDIGKKLNVANILEGSVRKQGNRVWIATQLIKTSDGFQIWSQKYDRELTDFFAVQEEVARAVTGNLRIKLLGEHTAAPSAQIKDADAYNAYLQGQYFLQHHTKENLEKAATYFLQATKLDPGYAKAWVGLGESRSNQALEGDVPAKEGFKQAREAVGRALVLDADLGVAHAALAWIQQFDEGNWAAAEASYERARSLEPGNAMIISHAGTLARILGRFDEATALGRRAIQLDPLNAGNYQNAGVSFYYAGQYEDAMAAFQKALELVPEMYLAHCSLGRVYLARSQPWEALAEMQKEKHPALRLFGIALAYHALGRKKESDAGMTELVGKFQQIASYQIAEAYAFRGETDRAFEWLERCYSERNLDQLKGDPMLKGLERDSRFLALLKKMSLPI